MSVTETSRGIRSTKPGGKAMFGRRQAEKDPNEGVPLHLVKPRPFEEWGTGRLVVLTGGSRTSAIAKAWVLHSDEEEDAFNRYFLEQETRHAQTAE